MARLQELMKITLDAKQVREACELYVAPMIDTTIEVADDRHYDRGRRCHRAGRPYDHGDGEQEARAEESKGSAMSVPDLTAAEWELIDDALQYWDRLFNAAITNSSYSALDAAGRHVQKRVLRIREKIEPMLAERAKVAT